MKLKSMLISVSSAILMSTLMAGCSGSKYSSVDNVQMSESKCDQISEYMHDYLSDQGLFVLDQSIEWCGYSKYQDLYSEEEYEDLGIGGYYIYYANLSDGSVADGRVVCYWGENEIPEILNLNTLYGDQKTVLVEYDDDKITECWNEYQERVFK